MTTQIFGTKKCRETQKAERWFHEHDVPYAFVDLDVKGISPGELSAIAMAVGLDALLDREGGAFAKSGLAHMVFDAEEEILENPRLMKTPVVRDNKRVSVGFKPEIWKAWFGK